MPRHLYLSFNLKIVNYNSKNCNLTNSEIYARNIKVHEQKKR